MTTLQQVYGDMVLDETQWVVVTTINETLRLKRSDDVKNMDLFVSEVVGPDKLPLALLCVLEKAAASTAIKQQLKRELVPVTPAPGYRYTLELPTVHKPQSISGRQLRSSTKRHMTVVIHGDFKKQRQLDSTEADLNATTATTIGTFDTKSQKGNGSRDNNNILQPLFPLLVQLDVGDGQLTPVAVQASVSNIMEFILLPLDYNQVKLLDVLAASSYGKVFKGCIDGKDVVIKVFDPRFDGFEAAFRRELQMYARSSQLQGDAVCAILHFGLLDLSGALFIAFSPAGTAIDSNSASHVAIQQGMRTALNKLHRQNIIHGDVRLNNFCVADDAHVRIIDLGGALDCSSPADAAVADDAAAAQAARKAAAAKQAEQHELDKVLLEATASTATIAAAH